jgi:hypothetical protein
VDRHAELRRFGGPGEPPLQAACSALGLDCEVLVRLGVKRLSTQSYVDPTVGTTRAKLSLLAFDDPELAYAYLTERIATGLELGQRLRVLEVGDAGVLGETAALFVKGALVAIASVASDRLAPTDLARYAEGVLPELASSLGAGVPAGERPLAALRLLPQKNRLPLSIRYEGFDLLGIAGVGRGARARFEEAGRRHEVVALTRSDEDAADDVIKTLRKVDGARKIKHAPYDAIRLRLVEGSEATDWVFGRRGNVVIGAGEPVVPMVGRKKTAAMPDKTLLRVKALLDRSREMLGSRETRLAPAGMAKP